MTVTDDRRIAEAATAGKWRQGATDGRTVWAGDGCTLGWVPVGRHVADAAHIANFTPSRVLRYVVLAEAASKLRALHVKRDQMIDNDTWESEGALPVYKSIDNAEKQLAAALAALDAPDDKEARGE